MIKKKILDNFRAEVDAFVKTTSLFSEEKFFNKTDKDKWSAAENVEHLYLVTKPLVGLFATPQVMTEKWGNATHPSRSYDEIVETYLEKINNGGKAPAYFVPLTTEPTKDEVIKKFESLNEKYIEGANAMTEQELDMYLLPHPLLGLLTVREFLTFYVYHTKHHHATVKGLLLASGS
jgi:hypothetical protein